MKSNKFLLAAALLLAGLSARAQEAEPTYLIDTVRVTALRTPMLRSDVPYSLTVIGNAELRRTPSLSVADLLPRFVPIESANLQGYMNDIELRGFTASAIGKLSYTRLLLDGMPIGTRYAATTFLGSLSGVEVLQGPFSSLYGSGAMGGVVNLVTSQSKGALAGKASLGYGSWNTFSAGAAVGGSIAEKLDFDLGFDYQKRADDYRTGGSHLLKTTDYEKEVYDPASYDVVYPNTRMERMRGSLRLGWDIAQNWRLNLYNELFHSPESPTNGTLWGINGYSDYRITRRFHRLDLTGNAGRHAIRVSPFVGREKEKATDISYGNSTRENDYNTFGFTAQDAVSFDRGSLVFGVDHLSERFNSANADADGTPTVPYNPDYRNAALGGFAQLGVALGDFSGIVGARYDNTFLKSFKTPMAEGDPSKKSFGAFSPNLSLQYRLGERVRLHTGVGRAFVAPNAFQLTGVYAMTSIYGVSIYRGNPDLKAETATTWEVGAGYTSLDKALELDATLFFTKHDHKIITSASSSADWTTTTYDYINAQKSSLGGFDIVAGFDLGRALEKAWSWRWRVNVERFFRAQVETAAGKETQRYLSRTKVAFGSSFDYKRLSIDLSGRYASARREENFLNWDPTIRPSLAAEGFIRTPDFITFDASAAYRATRRLTIRATGSNLLDELYMERDGYYMPGRNFQIGVSLSF